MDKFSLTILLWLNLRKIKIEKLASFIFARNKVLKGSLRPLKCKFDVNDDINQNDTSKKDWRLIYLKGNANSLI